MKNGIKQKEAAKLIGRSDRYLRLHRDDCPRLSNGNYDPVVVQQWEQLRQESKGETTYMKLLRTHKTWLQILILAERAKKLRLERLTAKPK